MRPMRMFLVLLAVGAGTFAGYLVGDRGEVDLMSGMIGAAALLAIAMAWMMPADAPRRTVSLRPRGARPAPAVERPALTPEDAARQREQERILSGAQVGVRLVETGRNQIAVIKVLRTYLDIGLKDGKDLSDRAKQGGRPLVAEAMGASRARDFAREMENAGGRLEFEETATR